MTRQALLILVAILVAFGTTHCGGTFTAPDAAPDAADDAAPDAAPDACGVWYDPAGGECVDTCTHELVPCADAGAEGGK